MKKLKPLVINLFGEPSVGKSVASAYIFAKLKSCGINCELVQEFAKDKVYEDNKEVFKNQAYIFGKQSFKMSRVSDKVDVIVTDSPLFLSAIYNKDKALGSEFENTVINLFNSYNNINILLERNHKYQNEGRLHNELQAKEIREELINKLDKHNIPYKIYKSSFVIYDVIVDKILENLKEEF